MGCRHLLAGLPNQRLPAERLYDQDGARDEQQCKHQTPKAVRRNPLVEPRADPRSEQRRRQTERGDQQNIRRDLPGDRHADTGERQNDKVEGLIDGAVRVGGGVVVGEL